MINNYAYEPTCKVGNLQLQPYVYFAKDGTTKMITRSKNHVCKPGHPSQLFDPETMFRYALPERTLPLVSKGIRNKMVRQPKAPRSNDTHWYVTVDKGGILRPSSAAFKYFNRGGNNRNTWAYRRVLKRNYAPARYNRSTGRFNAVKAGSAYNTDGVGVYTACQRRRMP